MNSNGLHFTKKIYSFTCFSLRLSLFPSPKPFSITLTAHSLYFGPSLSLPPISHFLIFTRPHAPFISILHLRISLLVLFTPAPLFTPTLLHTTSLCLLPFSPRLYAGHEQDTAHHGEGGHTFLQRLLYHAHVLPIAVVHPDREVCSQPPHLHQQRELLLALVAGPP